MFATDVTPIRTGTSMCTAAKPGIRLAAPEYSFDQEITALIFVEAGSAYSSLRRGPAHFLNTAASLSVLVKG